MAKSSSPPARARELDPATKRPIQNIYIKKVEKKKMFGYDNDELWNTVVKTYNDVSTFWHYDRRNSWRSRSTAAISRRVNSASEPDDHQCPLLAHSGHRLVRCTCLLLTQSGHNRSKMTFRAQLSILSSWADPGPRRQSRQFGHNPSTCPERGCRPTRQLFYSARQVHRPAGASAHARGPSTPEWRRQSSVRYSGVRDGTPESARRYSAREHPLAFSASASSIAGRL